MKKILLSIVSTVIITSGVSFADTYNFHLGASSSGLEAEFDVTRTIEQGSLTAGAGFLYEDNDDEYEIVHAKVALGNEILVPGLRGSLGFKGYLGDVEEDYSNEDGDLAAIAFLLLASYDVPETVSPIPIEISGHASVAPDPLCFADAERYREIGLSLGFQIIDSGAIVLGYRYIKVDIEKHDQDWTMRDDSVSIGFRLKF